MTSRLTEAPPIAESNPRKSARPVAATAAGAPAAVPPAAGDDAATLVPGAHAQSGGHASPEDAAVPAAVPAFAFELNPRRPSVNDSGTNASTLAPEVRL